MLCKNHKSPSQQEALKTTPRTCFRVTYVAQCVAKPFHQPALNLAAGQHRRHPHPCACNNAIIALCKNALVLSVNQLAANQSTDCQSIRLPSNGPHSQNFQHNYSRFYVICVKKYKTRLYVLVHQLYVLCCFSGLTIHNFTNKNNNKKKHHKFLDSIPLAHGVMAAHAYLFRRVRLRTQPRRRIESRL